MNGKGVNLPLGFRRRVRRVVDMDRAVSKILKWLEAPDGKLSLIVTYSLISVFVLYAAVAALNL